MFRIRLILIFGAAIFLLAACGESVSERGATAEPGQTAFAAPAFHDVFWDTWGDGKAEIATYDLLMPRYGETRMGMAVAIFVTETFSNELRVKATSGEHPPSDKVPVMKLNLVEDFPTGVYDYNWMTSTFMALESVNGRRAGFPMKISFSSQEWCGHVYSQLLLDENRIRHTAHSYFDGEADQRGEIGYPVRGISEDALWFWVRGFAAPLLGAGESAKVEALTSLKRSRARHQDLKWAPAVLSRAAEAQQIIVPAGEFKVEKWSAAIGDDLTRTFYVEIDPPHRIVQWESSEGEQAQMIASERIAYWKMNGPGDITELSSIGLSARPPRTP